jgi:CubicO group peptidase (beta-lactamase class C family)
MWKRSLSAFSPVSLGVLQHASVRPNRDHLAWRGRAGRSAEGGVGGTRRRRISTDWTRGAHDMVAVALRQLNGRHCRTAQGTDRVRALFRRPEAYGHHISFSITKSFVGTIAAALVAEGALDADASVASYVGQRVRRCDSAAAHGHDDRHQIQRGPHRSEGGRLGSEPRRRHPAASAGPHRAEVVRLTLTLRRGSSH